MFDLVKLALAVMQLVNYFMEKREREGLLTEGEKRAYGKQLVENARRAGIVKAIDEKFQKASDDEVLQELKNDFRD